jgi:hypothetical protein
MGCAHLHLSFDEAQGDGGSPRGAEGWDSLPLGIEDVLLLTRVLHREHVTKQEPHLARKIPSFLLEAVTVVGGGLELGAELRAILSKISEVLLRLLQSIHVLDELHALLLVDGCLSLHLVHHGRHDLQLRARLGIAPALLGRLGHLLVGLVPGWVKSAVRSGWWQAWWGGGGLKDLEVRVRA